MLARKNGVQVKFAVPAWLAGVWTRSQATETSRIQLPSGRRLSPVGHRWQKCAINSAAIATPGTDLADLRACARFRQRRPRGESIDYHAVGSYEIVILGPKTVAVEVQACHAVVNKKTKKLTSSYQDEELNTYTEITDSVARTDSSVKVFDTRGKPLLLTRAASTESKIGPFVATMTEPKLVQHAAVSRLNSK